MTWASHHCCELSPISLHGHGGRPSSSASHSLSLDRHCLRRLFTPSDTFSIHEKIKLLVCIESCISQISFPFTFSRSNTEKRPSGVALSLFSNTESFVSMSWTQGQTIYLPFCTAHAQRCNFLLSCCMYFGKLLIDSSCIASVPIACFLHTILCDVGVFLSN